VTGVTLRGEAGDDALVAGAGQTTLDGGEGSDTADYRAAAVGVRVDLGAGTADAGHATDELADVETVTGSPGDDELIGDGAANVLSGEAGDDTVDGVGEADTLLGGDGIDTVAFGGRAAVDVDLKEGTAQGAGDDTLEGFENVTGTAKADAIRAGEGTNVLEGLGGADEIHGGDGNDEVIGGDGNDRLFGDKGRDRLRGGAGRDQLSGGDGRDRCRGGADPDSFVFCERRS
jgi:Ca2+-binding RTX toxin-like protein